LGAPQALMISGAYDIGGVAAAGTLGVKGVDGAALEGSQRILHEARFVQRVGVDRHLNVVLLGHVETVVDRSRRSAPIFVQLEPDAASHHLLDQRLGQAGVAFA
jgi:hypothetical protein